MGGHQARALDADPPPPPQSGTEVPAVGAGKNIFLLREGVKMVPPPPISLWDVTFHANTERFRGSVPLLPHLCPLSVPEVGVCGVYSESP